jgi:hypothetical protein
MILVGVTGAAGEHPEGVGFLDEPLASLAELTGTLKEIGDVGLVGARRLLHR